MSEVIPGFRYKWRKSSTATYDKLRSKRMVMMMPRIWDVKLIKVESPDYDNSIMVNFVEIGRTRRSLCQLCLSQTDDWTTAGNGF